MKASWTRRSLDLAAGGLLLGSVLLVGWLLGRSRGMGGSRFESLLLLAVAFYGAAVGFLLLRLGHRDRRMIGLFPWLCGLDRLLGALTPPLDAPTLAPVLDHLAALFPGHCGWVGLLRAPGLLLRGVHVRRRCLPVVSEHITGGWEVGRVERLLRERMADGQGGLVRQPLPAAEGTHLLLLQVTHSPSGDVAAALAVVLRRGRTRRDLLTGQALTAGLTLLTQRMVGLLVEVMAQRDGLGLENLGMVMRVLAHEINNDLQGALNHLEGGSRKDVGALLARAAHWSHLMREAPFLVDRMLPVERGVVALDDCVRQAIAEMRVAWPALSFEIDQPAEAQGLRVVGDGHLGSVLRNLVHNAASFSPDGEPVQVAIRQDGAFAHVLVQDAGPGVDPADVDRIFAPLGNQRAPRRGGGRVGQGMGVGLTLARAIVRACGGELHCHSNHGGRGGLFEVVLALCDDEQGGQG